MISFFLNMNLHIFKGFKIINMVRKLLKLINGMLLAKFVLFVIVRTLILRSMIGNGNVRIADIPIPETLMLQRIFLQLGHQLLQLVR